MPIDPYLKWLELLKQLIQIVIDWLKSNPLDDQVAHLFHRFIDHAHEMHTIHEVIAELRENPNTEELAETLDSHLKSTNFRA